MFAETLEALLRPLKVIIPYIEQIEFPASWMRGRRDNQRLLSLIEGVAFLHQGQREVRHDHDGTEYIEASLEDYAVAYDLAHQVFAQTTSDLSKPVRDFRDQMERCVGQMAHAEKTKVHEFWFTRRMVREATRVPDYLVKLYMRQIEDLEYIQVERAVRGSSFRYRLLPEKKTGTVLAGLTTPEELQRKIGPVRAGQKVGVSGSKVEVTRKRS